jgi:hypothetical protein
MGTFFSLSNRKKCSTTAFSGKKTYLHFQSAALLHFRGKKHTCIFGEKNIPAFSSGFLMTLVAPLILSHNCNANDRYI